MCVYVDSLQPVAEYLFYSVSLYLSSLYLLKKGSGGYGFWGYRNFSSLKALEPERLSFLSCSIQKLIIP